jgi:hypothetical protein
MSLRAEAAPDEPGLQSFLYGPLVLAADLGGDGLSEDLVRNSQGPHVAKAPVPVPVLSSKGRPVSEWLKPAGTAPLEFEAAASTGRLRFSPISRHWKRYAVYFDVG